jgi:Protein of unknown function (DUF4058)
MAEFRLTQSQKQFILERSQQVQTRSDASPFPGMVPDAAIVGRQSQERLPIETPAATAIALMSVPETVMLPTMESIKERYLEIRDIKTDAVITVIEVLSPNLILDLQALVDQIYDEARYKMRIDDTEPVPPPALLADEVVARDDSLGVVNGDDRLNHLFTIHQCVQIRRDDRLQIAANLLNVPIPPSHRQ